MSTFQHKGALSDGGTAPWFPLVIEEVNNLLSRLTGPRRESQLMAAVESLLGFESVFGLNRKETRLSDGYEGSRGVVISAVQGSHHVFGELLLPHLQDYERRNGSLADRSATFYCQEEHKEALLPVLKKVTDRLDQLTRKSP